MWQAQARYGRDKRALHGKNKRVLLRYIFSGKLINKRGLYV